MLDPFYNPVLMPISLYGAMQDASDYRSDVSLALIDNMASTYVPLRHYRAARVIASHILVLTLPTSANFPTGSIELDMLHPGNTPLNEMRATDPTVDNTAWVVDTLHIRAFITALIHIGELSVSDMQHLATGNPLRSPARAELFQNTSVGLVDYIDNPFIEHLPNAEPMVGTDRLSLDITSSMHHEVIFPILLPTDRLSFTYPNRAYQTTKDDHYHTAGIPLAWTWDPSLVGHKEGFREFNQTSYGAAYSPDRPYDLITSARSMTFSLSQGLGDYRPPTWEYAIVSTQVPTSPFEPATTHYGSNPALIRSAQLLTDLQAARYRSQPAKIEKLSGAQWPGFDTAMIERTMGASMEDAVKQNITTMKGMGPTSWFPPEHVHADLSERWSRTCTDYGPLAALLGGLRYVTTAILTGRIQGLDFDSIDPPPSPSLRNPMPPPTHERLELLEAATGGKPQYKPQVNHRKDVAHRARRGNPVAAGQAGKRLFTDQMTQGDITTARTLVLPGAYTTLRRVLTMVNEGATDPTFIGWINKALELSAGMLTLQNELLKMWCAHNPDNKAAQHVVTNDMLLRRQNATLPDLIEALTRLANREMRARGGVYQHMRRTLAGETPVRGRPRKRKK